MGLYKCVSPRTLLVFKNKLLVIIIIIIIVITIMMLTINHN